MVFGYRGNRNWRDMSEYVVHFTKGSGDEPYWQMMDILSTRELRHEVVRTFLDDPVR
jgi:hypothetical protein